MMGYKDIKQGKGFIRFYIHGELNMGRNVIKMGMEFMEKMKAMRQK